MKLVEVIAAGAAALVISGPAVAATTGVTGSGAPIGNYQPSLVLNQQVAIQGLFPPRDCAGCSATNWLGTVHTFAGGYNAFGMPAANGQLLSISQNTALFAILGTQYGGNGQTTFALPNLAGRVAVGSGQGPGLSDYLQGQNGGSAQTIMTVDQLPAHDHGLPGGGATGSAGLGQPLDNTQPYLAMNYQIAVNGGADYPDTFVGTVALFGGAFDPGGYLPADGRLLAISQYATLYNAIGTTYGGDGVNTFALPDLRGRTIVGAADGLALGTAFGQEQVFLTEDNLAAHDHTLPGGGLTDLAGGGLPFDNAQPSLALNYLISLGGIYPSRDSGGAAPDDSPWYGEIVATAGGVVPNGWHLADGAILPIAQYQALFSILGCDYGGNCQTTFALPDLRGRAIMGAGNGFTVGQTFGERYTSLTVAQLAPHVHDLPDTAGVPEPAAWALMIAGFGLAGGALRRRILAT
jgi:microcystin-dependent protein